MQRDRPESRIAPHWRTVTRALTRPYRVTLPMVALVSMVPFYIFIAAETRGRVQYAPELPLDRLVPLSPAWAIVYGALYLFLILLPVLVVSRQEHIRRTVLAYLFIWMTAYVFFLAYPTVAPRPGTIEGGGFAVWGLRFLYEADPPYNCFPSLHVAHSFVSALTCLPLHRRLGAAAVACASLVGMSTLFTRQHYVLDVIAGVALAGTAYMIFLHKYRADDIRESERRDAAVVAAALLGFVGVVTLCCYLMYVAIGAS